MGVPIQLGKMGGESHGHALVSMKNIKDIVWGQQNIC